MTFAKILLGLNGLAFAGYGIACLLSPALPAGYAGMEIDNASARVEIVAMYGGLQLGVGALLLYCMLEPKRMSAGLTLTAVLVGSLALARAFGLAIHGVSDYNLGALAYEATTAVLALVALRVSDFAAGASV